MVEHPHYIVGLHEGHMDNGYELLPPGSWLFFTVAIGHDPNNFHGDDFSKWSNMGYRIMVRINNGYNPHGTIPQEGQYGNFAMRVANYIASSRGCEYWVIGNEMNHETEWPYGEVITKEQYVKCFNACCKEVGDAQVAGLIGKFNLLIGAVAPWNVQAGDWLDYFQYIVENTLLDGITIHTYTHGSDPALVTSQEKMQSHPDRYYHFLAYIDFMDRIPTELVHLPVYITETDQNVPWENVNSGWVKEAYKEINAWNQYAAQGLTNFIHSLILYRWPKIDKWYIVGKEKVIKDFEEAIEYGYIVERTPEMPEWKTIYYNDCEQYYDQDGQPELTIPVGSDLHYRHTSHPGDFPRPEMDHKKTSDGQSEVYSPPGASATGFYISSMGQFAWVFDKISVTPGDKLRASAVYMHIAHEGGQNGECGGRIGLVLGDSPFDTPQRRWPKDGPNPFEHESIFWSDNWLTSRRGSSDYLQDRIWTLLETGEVPHGVSKVRAIVFFTSDNTQTVHGFVDDVTIEIYTDQDVEPPVEIDCIAEEAINQQNEKLALIFEEAYVAIEKVGITLKEFCLSATSILRD